jgi:hypothetical protein
LIGSPIATGRPLPPRIHHQRLMPMPRGVGRSLWNLTDLFGLDVDLLPEAEAGSWHRGSDGFDGS